MVQLLWKTVQQFLKKVNIEVPCDPAILLLDIHPKHLKARSQREGLPCGPVVKNLPANAGDMGLTPGLGRSHMPWGN